MPETRRLCWSGLTEALLCRIFTLSLCWCRFFTRAEYSFQCFLRSYIARHVDDDALNRERVERLKNKLTISN
jgi:hypothetical protein